MSYDSNVRENPNIRYMNRTHRINVAWIHETFKGGLFELDRCPTEEMEADIFTKPIVKPDYWTKARRNISIAFTKEQVWETKTAGSNAMQDAA